MISDKMLELGTTRSVTRELFEYGKGRSAVIGAENVFDFSLGNPSVPPPEAVNQKTIGILQENPLSIHSYTSEKGDQPSREKFAASITKRSGMAYHEDNFYLTAGAAAALSCCTRALTCPGDEWIVLAPFFPEYAVYVQSNDAKMVVIPPLLPSFQMDLKEIEQKINGKTKGIIVNSPNNPSGAVYSEESLKQLGDILRKKSEEFGEVIYLISDEPYRELIYDGTTAPWIPQYYKNTLVCYSFSKSLSLPGQRMGYVLVGDQVDQWEKIYWAIAGAGRSLGYVNAPSLFQRVAAECCDMTSDLSIYKGNRDLLCEKLTEFGFQVGQPVGAFYLFPKSLEEDDTAFCERAKEFDLILVPGSAFGVAGYFRLAYCVAPDKVERSLEKFQALAQSYGATVN